MANSVFANGREIACKAAAGKTICAFPDVCFTPPQTPGTPPGVPIPYPNTAYASDTASGSKNVMISDEEIMLKNKSYFKKSMGDEAGCAPLKGLITHKNRGKAYFTTWSMDVKIEGENVDRHLDLTTANHGSTNANEGAPWPYLDSQALPPSSKCHGDKKKKDDACDGKDPCPGVLKMKPGKLKKQVARAPSKRAPRGSESKTSKAAKVATAEAEKSDCVKASRCHLRPYKPKKGQPGCCPGQTPHHIPPKTCFKGVWKYNKNRALCVCMEGTSQHTGSHGKNHAAIDYLAKKNGIGPGKKCSIAKYNKICAQAVAVQCGCSAECIEQQLNESLKPTNRNIKHWDSSSKQLDSKTKAKLEKAYDASSGNTFSG